MKIMDIESLAIPDIKVVKFARFSDHRGYFSEHYRASQFKEMDFMKDVDFQQCNEAFSKKGTIRGLHFQWSPYMGKLVRPLFGRMIDLILDIRKGSPTLGKIIAYDMPIDREAEAAEWIWLPPGFAHGNIFTEDSMIEYFCSGEWSPETEAGISPLAEDLDWSLCDENLKKDFDNVVNGDLLISDKDRDGLTMNAWLEDNRSDNFVY